MPEAKTATGGDAREQWSLLLDGRFSAFLEQGSRGCPPETVFPAKASNATVWALACE